jgi:hypothetical protein
VRLEILDGTDRTPLVDVDRANSIENRLIKLLQYLDANRPGEGWGGFLDAAGQPRTGTYHDRSDSVPALSGLGEDAGLRPG